MVHSLCVACVIACDRCASDETVIESQLQVRAACAVVLWELCMDEGDGWYKILVADVGKMMQLGNDRFDGRGNHLPCELAVAVDPALGSLHPEEGVRLRVAALTFIRSAAVQTL